MSADFAAARTNMVESQVRTQDVTDLGIQDAMRVVARESLVPGARAGVAYADVEIEYAPGRWLLKPRDVAKLLQALKPRPGERALAICAPYAAAVLGEIGLDVTQSDGEPPAGATFDVIVCEGAVAACPPAWRDALAPDGRLGVVERAGPQGRAVLYLRADDVVGSRPLFDASPPYMAGYEPARRFAF